MTYIKQSLMLKLFRIMINDTISVKIKPQVISIDDMNSSW